MNGFVKGILLGAAAGAAADMALHTASGRRTKAGKTMQSVTDAVDSAAAAVKHTMGRGRPPGTGTLRRCKVPVLFVR